jgi:hypothetical protein
MEYGIAFLTIQQDESIKVSYKGWSKEKDPAVFEMQEASFSNIHDALDFLKDRVEDNIDTYRSIFDTLKGKGQI